MVNEKVKVINHANVYGSDQWILDATIVIQRGIITHISFSGNFLPSTAKECEIINARGMLAVPGLTNGHTHLSQVFMRGLAGGRPLLKWLRELIWPLQASFSSEEMHLAAMLGLAENLRGGVTEVIDHHKITQTRAHTKAVANAVEELGIRCTIARAWVNKGKNAEDDGQILEELAELFSENDQNNLLAYASGPLTPWRASADLLQKTHQLASENNSFSHIHVSETMEEVQMSLDEYGCRPLTWLNQIGILDQHCQIVHAVCVDETEMNLLADTHAPVVHCPVSNAVLGSGVAPLRKLLDRGIQVRLGTDGPASNDTQDCFESMKMALCLARASFQDANNISCEQVLSMAFDTKQLKVGASADIALIDVNTLNSAPVQDFSSALVLSTRKDDVDTILVNGEILMQNKKLKTIDEELLIKECNKAIKNLRKRAGLDL